MTDAQIFLFWARRSGVNNMRIAGGRGGVHPMMRHLTDAAPQEGERAFRSGALPGSEQPETAAERGMRGAAEREMGDLNEAGDAPFGGEVAVDSQVRAGRASGRP